MAHPYTFVMKLSIINMWLKVLNRKGQYLLKSWTKFQQPVSRLSFPHMGFQNQFLKMQKHAICFILTLRVPLVSKVHKEAEIHFRKGNHILLIGHTGHPEVIGTMGQLPDGAVTLIETVEDAKLFKPIESNKLAYVTQTTLSVDDTHEIIEILKKRFPNIVGPNKEDICYATTNRQEAVKAVAPRADAMIVVGAPNSSNSMRLCEVSKRAGCNISYLIQNASEIRWDEFKNLKTIAITAGASAPEILVDEIIDSFSTRFDLEVETIQTAQESISFKLPRELRSIGTD